MNLNIGYVLWGILPCCMHMNRHKSALIFLLKKNKYSVMTKSILWLLMTWLLALSGHQQVWHMVCRIIGYMSSSGKHSNHMQRLRLNDGTNYSVFIFWVCAAREGYNYSLLSGISYFHQARQHRINLTLRIDLTVKIKKITSKGNHISQSLINSGLEWDKRH